MMSKVVGALVGATMLCAQAGAACWTPREAAAAQVRGLDTLMMVASLGCRNWDPGVAARYNEFVERQRPTLLAANGLIREHYARSYGRFDGEEAYDAFVTRVANRFGGGHAGLDCGDFARMVEDAGATEGSFGELTALANSARVDPMIDDELCGREGGGEGW